MKKPPKVTLISTNASITENGLRTLSSVLKNNNILTQLIFLPSYKERYSQDVLNQVRTLAMNSILIGITCYEITSTKALQIIDHLQQLHIPIIWGGIYATLNPEDAIRFADIVCIGEGENALSELVEIFVSGRDRKDVQNFWFKDNGTIIKNPVRPRVQNLDLLPSKDYSTENQFVLERGRLRRFSEKHLRYGEFNQDHEVTFQFGTHILEHSQRGCPNSCAYCCNSFLHKLYPDNSKIVKKSIDKMIEEIRQLKSRFSSISFIWFTDDSFFTRSAEEIREFSRSYKKEVALPFMCYTTPTTLNDEKLALLLDCGLYRVEMGIQTGSQRTSFGLYDRKISNDEVIHAAEILSRYKKRMVIPEYQIIIFNPYEQNEDVLQTIDLIKKLPTPFYLQPFNLVFFHGTEFSQKAILEGKIRRDYDFYSYIHYSDTMAHVWKINENLFGNALLHLSSGTVTEKRIGPFPRFLFESLISSRARTWFDRHPKIIKWIVFITPKISRIFFILPPAIRRIAIELMRCYYFFHNPRLKFSPIKNTAIR